MKETPLRKDVLNSTIDYKKLIELQGNSYTHNMKYGEMKSNNQKVQNNMKIKRKTYKSKIPQKYLEE